MFDVQSEPKHFKTLHHLHCDASVADELVNLRGEMIWDGSPIGDYFDATSGKQEVRSGIYDAILKHDVRIQKTICKKAKAQPKATTSKARFYQTPWYYTLKHGIAPHIEKGNELLATAASIGTRKERLTHCKGSIDVMGQTLGSAKRAVAFRPSHCDPCLHVADYCAWAITWKPERRSPSKDCFDSHSTDALPFSRIYFFDYLSIKAPKFYPPG